MAIVAKIDDIPYEYTAQTADKQDVCYRVSHEHISQDAQWLTVDLCFLDALAGDEGYYVLPDAKVNFLTYFKPRKDTEFRLQGNLLPMIGAKLSNGAVLVVMEGMSLNYSLFVHIRDGRYGLQLRYNLSRISLYEDICIRVITLDSPDATYADIARAYREITVARKQLVPLAKRMENEPVLAYGAVDMPIIRVRMAWKPAPSPVAEQTIETEPPLHVACNFDQVSLLLDELKQQGVEKAEVCLVGWNIRGHDGRWPQMFPVEDALGGEEALRRLIAHAKELGYRITCHTNSSEAYRIAECWDEKDLVKCKDGSVSINQDVWSGGRAYHLCPKVACEKHLPNNLAKVKELGFEGFHYIDVLSILVPKTCFDPEHPLTAAQAARYVNDMFGQARKAIGGSGSEGAYDFAVPGLDFALYTVFNSLSGMPEIADQAIPLWQLVYHGYVLSNPSVETVNFMIKKPENRLRFYEYGGTPVMYYFTCFVGENSVGNWMGDEDIFCDTDEHRKESVQKIKKLMDEYHAFAPLQLAFMDDHRMLADGVFETVYSDGHHTVVNYSDKAFDMGERVIPAKEVVLFKKQ